MLLWERKCRNKTGQNDLEGFCKGVCHPLDEKIDELQEANVEWVRFDVGGQTLDKKGQETQGYVEFKKRYRDVEYRILVMSPFPYRNMQRHPLIRSIQSITSRSQQIPAIWHRICRVISIFQIVNEMLVEHFRFLLSTEQSYVCLGIQLEALQKVKGSIKTGFIFQSFTMVLYLRRIKPYFAYCDYIGLDLYIGCFESLLKDICFYDFIIRFIWGIQDAGQNS